MANIDPNAYSPPSNTHSNAHSLSETRVEKFIRYYTHLFKNLLKNQFKFTFRATDSKSIFTFTNFHKKSKFIRSPSEANLLSPDVIPIPGVIFHRGGNGSHASIN